MMKKIFLDLDGVIVDFVGGLLKRYNVSNEHYTEHWPIGHWGNKEIFEKVFKVPYAELWRSCDDDFWENLDFLPDAKETLEFLKPYKPCILTKCAKRGASGKQLWIKKHLPDYFDDNRYLIGPAKTFCAGPDRVLIDDCIENCKAFDGAGGLSVEIPRRWNIWHDADVTPVEALQYCFTIFGVEKPVC